MGSLPLESIWHLKIEQTFPSTDMASLPASERRATEPAVSHAAPPRPHPAASGAERVHVGPGGCPGILPFLPPSRAPPSLPQQQGGAAPGPLLSPGFRGRARLFTGSHPLPLGLRPRSASTSLAKVPSAPACMRGGVFTLLAVQTAEPPQTRLRNAASVCPALQTHRDFSGNLGAHLENMVLGSSSDAHEGDNRGWGGGEPRERKTGRRSGDCGAEKTRLAGGVGEGWEVAAGWPEELRSRGWDFKPGSFLASGVP